MTAAILTLKNSRTFEEVVDDVALGLITTKRDLNKGVEAKSWAMARLYCDARHELERLYKERHRKADIRKINKAIVMRIRELDPAKTVDISSAWFSHILKIQQLTGNEIVAGDKVLGFSLYKDIANAKLKWDNKKSLLEEAENKHLSREQVRSAIKTRQADETGVYRPDFDLKVSNHWRFGSVTDKVSFDGGIHPELVANLIHYYTNPGGVIVDPMAGSGVLERVLGAYDYFKSQIPTLPNSGPRTALMSDIAPTNSNIIEADAIHGLPFGNECADMVIFDPPYWKVAKEKYGIMGESIDEWRENIQAVMKNCINVLKRGGKMAVIVDDYLRTNESEPLFGYVLMAGMGLGLRTISTIYNPFPNFVLTMGPQGMENAKNARIMANGMKIISVFEKS